MKKNYESPELKIVTFSLDDVLSVSDNEVIATTGVTEALPDPGFVDDGL